MVLVALNGRCAAVDLDLYSVGKWSLGADASSGVEALALVGDHVLVAAGSEGLVIVNVQDPANPRQVGRYLPRIKDANIFVDGQVYGIWISGSRAFVGVGGSGPHLLDIREPANPKELAIIHYPWSAFDNLV